MKKYGLVLLNYNTARETISLIKQFEILKKKFNINVITYIIDNASTDDSVQIFNNEYSNSKHIKLFFNSKNEGFARGSNVGISAASADKCDYIISSNSDININTDQNFTEIIENIYENDTSIAVIGPRIRTLDNYDQSPLLHKPYSRFKIFLLWFKSLTKFNYLILGFLFILWFDIKKKYLFPRITRKDVNEEYVYSIFCAFMILTPAYFKVYKDLDPNTFLYCEEYVLAERVRQAGLKEYLTLKFSVQHYEGISTKNKRLFNRNYFKNRRFYLTNTYYSLRYFLYNYILKKDK